MFIGRLLLVHIGLYIDIHAQSFSLDCNTQKNKTVKALVLVSPSQKKKKILRQNQSNFINIEC